MVPATTFFGYQKWFDYEARFSFVATVTIIPFVPDGWAASAGGFPAMTGNAAADHDRDRRDAVATRSAVGE